MAKLGIAPEPATHKGGSRLTLDQTEDKTKVLFYGDPGTGKTSNLAALAKRGKVIYVDAEAGLKKGALTKLGIPVENIEVVRTVTFQEMEALFFELKGELEDDPEAYAGVVMDSLTEIQKKLLEVIVQQGVDKANRKGMERDEFAVYKEDWGVNTEQMRRIIRKFRDLPCHVGFACLPRRDQDDDGAVIYGPALTPALQADVVGYVDVICCTMPVEIIGGEEVFQGIFRRVGKYMAKDRFNALPRRLINPTMDRVVSYVNGTLTEETDEIQQKFRSAYAKAQADKKATVGAKN